MKFEDFKNLKNEIKDKNFFTNYQGFSKLCYFLSYVGNAFSILFAYFFINEIIMSTVLNPTPSVEKICIGVSIIILIILELMKRFMFDKFSQSAIKEKFKFKEKESVVLGLICTGLIVTSFFFSLNGAESYADKSDDIKQNVEVQVTTYSDSLNRKYDIKITDLEGQNKTLFETNQGYESRLTTLSNQYNDGTLSSSDLRRVKTEMNQIRKDKEINTQFIAKNETKIKEIKTEKEAEVNKFESKKDENASKTIEKTSQNPFIFLVFSTVIEFIILFGIWFINYYKVRSVEDYEKQISKNPKYKTFNNWNLFLDVIYKSDTKLGDVLPYKVEIMKILKSNEIDLSTKELDDMIKIFGHLGILKVKGNKKAIAVSKEDAIEAVRIHLKID